MSIVHHPGSAPIARTRTPGAVVLRPAGALDAPLADELRIQSLEAHAPVVVDLDACERVDDDALTVLTSSWAFYRPAIHLVSGDQARRDQVVALDVADPLPVHGSVDDALAYIEAVGA